MTGIDRLGLDWMLIAWHLLKGVPHQEARRNMNDLPRNDTPTAAASALLFLTETGLKPEKPHSSAGRIGNVFVGAHQLWAAHFEAGQACSERVSHGVQLRMAREKSGALQLDNARLRRKAVRLALMVAGARHHAQHDELTGLPSRRLLIDRCQQALSQARRKHEQVGFMMIDLNGFKRINDRFGHEAGDELLKHVATCLVSCIRRGDTVCRYGGDEFVIMLPGLDDRERMVTLGAKIHARLQAHYAVQGQAVGIVGSIGTSIFPSDGDSFKMLINQADTSMYWNKLNPDGRSRPALANQAGST